MRGCQPTFYQNTKFVKKQKIIYINRENEQKNLLEELGNDTSGLP